MAVITISRQFGSGGDEISARVAEIIGYQLFDKGLIYKAAAEAGLSDREIIDFSEDNFKVHTFLDRLFGRSQPVIRARQWKDSGTGEFKTEEIQLDDQAILTLVQKAVLSAYEAGNMIIVGRGGQVILKDHPGVLHVRIEAPLEMRIQRMKEQIRQTRQEYNADITLRREAQDMIEERDAASEAYIQKYYNVSWNDPYLYHVVFNTARLSIEQASQFIVRLMLEFEPHKKTAIQA